MLGDIELGAKAPVATPKKALSKRKSFWRGASFEINDTSAISANAEATSRIQPNSERRRVSQNVENPTTRLSRRTQEEIDQTWHKYFSGRVAAVNKMTKNGKPFDCSGFLFLCWQDDGDIDNLASAVAVPIPDQSTFTEVEVWHIIRDEWLQSSGQWKRYNPFHRVCEVSFFRAYPLYINPAGDFCVLLAGLARLGDLLIHRLRDKYAVNLLAEDGRDLHPGEVLRLKEEFLRSINSPGSARGVEFIHSESLFHRIRFLTQDFTPNMELHTYFIREEVQFTRTWAALLFTTAAIAVVVLVGLKVIFPSWDTTFAAGSYIVTVVTIPVMIFISKLEKHPSRIVGTEGRRKRE